ncbi:MAG TPA: hypothetical protein VFT12_10955 [Thermoanaerobaculia bacterium]|nr:hypothetical protein [Thermoanaerobaculia bacterium]
MKSCLALASLLMVVADLNAAGRTYAGTFTSGWQTDGVHGHDQPPCAPARRLDLPDTIFHSQPACDGVDFARGNLDNNIGFRTGKEWDLWQRGRLSLVGGGEASLSHTEYNLSQNDFVFASATAFGGADIRLGSITLGGRAGLGPFMTSDGREKGFQRTMAVHVTLPLSQGAAFRISRNSMSVFGSERDVHLYGSGAPDVVAQTNRHGELLPPPSVRMRRAPIAFETSFLLVTSPEYRGASAWEYASLTGTTNPGGPLGSSRKLRISHFQQLTAARRLPWNGWEGRVMWTASAHESSRPTVFKGYDNNYRSKTINGFGIALSRSNRFIFEQVSLHYGAGLEGADWRDEHHLLTRNGETVQAGVELAMTAHTAIRWHFAPNIALQSSYEKAYWRNIDLGENRVGFALVVTSFSAPSSLAQSR